jgi:hypothetical protein
MLSSPGDLRAPNSIIPGLREAISITTPLILSQNPSPKVKSKKHKSWTKAEQILAGKAIPASSVEHLKELVEYIARLVRLTLTTMYSSLKMHTRAGGVKKTAISECCTRYLKGA